MKVFVFDAAKCNGCHNCQIACKDEHVGNEWLPYAKPQPNTGQFWMRVKQTEHGQIPMVKVEYTAWPCMHCDNPKCLEAAPDAVYKRDDGLVIIDPEKAKGHRELIDACPYGAIFYNEELDLPQKCTGCAHLVDKGQLPHCVDLCATGGLRFGEEEEFADEIAVAETMLPETGCSPRVYYVNLPHLFLGGEVWDPEEDAIIEGATITLSDAEGQVAQLKSDDFGDFKFEKLLAGTYDLLIEADGFESVTVPGIKLTQSTYLGDYPLKRA